MCELLAAEEHEVSLRHRRVRRKRAGDSASKLRRSLRLAAKEDPYYVDATSKASRVKAAQLDLSRASARLRGALEQSGILERPPPARIASRKLRLLGKVCGISTLSGADGEVPSVG
jgi:hypothetical protein